MRGIKVASAIVGGALVTTVLIIILVIGLMSWLGALAGGIAAIAFIVIALFILIAVMANRE